MIGGVAAVLGGAPISTFDLDIVHRRNTDNVTRLLVRRMECADRASLVEWPSKNLSD